MHGAGAANAAAAAEFRAAQVQAVAQHPEQWNIRRDGDRARLTVYGQLVCGHVVCRTKLSANRSAIDADDLPMKAIQCFPSGYTRKTSMEPFRIANRVVDPSLNRITMADGSTVQVEPKVMSVLVILSERPGEVVTREELLSRVWNGVFVTDDAVHRTIRELRRLFHDDAEAPRVIETIRKRGYRLIVPVEPAAKGARVGDSPRDWPPGQAPGLARSLAQGQSPDHHGSRSLGNWCSDTVYVLGRRESGTPPSGQLHALHQRSGQRSRPGPLRLREAGLRRTRRRRTRAHLY
jgi:DNA-binding winged helix-turn-helix (wHTH) protein